VPLLNNLSTTQVNKHSMVLSSASQNHNILFLKKDLSDPTEESMRTTEED